MTKEKVLFFNIATFHFTAGIEKVNRNIYKVLADENQKNPNFDYSIISIFDNDSEFDSRYGNLNKVKNFNKSKLLACVAAIRESYHSNTIIINHINIAPVGLLIKLIFPSKNVILIAHGIEIWKVNNLLKKISLLVMDRIIAVSQYTKDLVSKNHNIKLTKIAVCNNCLDPFIGNIKTIRKSPPLMNKIGICDTDFVLFSLTRLSSNEKYKGYDKVFLALRNILKRYPNLKYIIGGKGDEQEIQRINNMINEWNLNNNVHLLGFINDNEVPDHFGLADLFVMPSLNEGFGLVFIEAAFHGLPALAGKNDGSVDAMLNGKLGYMVSPENIKSIEDSIIDAIENKPNFDHNKQIKMVIDNFSHNVYHEKFIKSISFN